MAFIMVFTVRIQDKKILIDTIFHQTQNCNPNAMRCYSWLRNLQIKIDYLCLWIYMHIRLIKAALFMEM